MPNLLVIDYQHDPNSEESFDDAIKRLHKDIERFFEENGDRLGIPRLDDDERLSDEEIDECLKRLTRV
jgi:arsenate reductase-like glutaredoxin family protein